MLCPALGPCKQRKTLVIRKKQDMEAGIRVRY